MRTRPAWKAITILAAFCCAVVCGTALNFLAKRAALGEPPIALNGWRTLTAAAILLVLVLLLRVSVRLSLAELRWYAVLAALTMAVPHALIFFALRELNVTETTVAFVEAAVLGVVVVYLMAWSRRVGIGAAACTVLTLLGLGVFLQFGPGAFVAWAGDTCIIAAALATAIGLILAEKIEPQAEDKSFPGKCRRSTKKTFFACLISGSGTLLAIAVTNGVSGAASDLVPVPAAASWPWIVALALVGSCLTWFSLFLLIELGQLVLAAAVIAVTPVTTELANYFFFQPQVSTIHQWLGGALVLVSLGILIALQLRTPDKAPLAPGIPPPGQKPEEAEAPTRQCSCPLPQWTEPDLA